MPIGSVVDGDIEECIGYSGETPNCAFFDKEEDKFYLKGFTHKLRPDKIYWKGKYIQSIVWCEGDCYKKITCGAALDVIENSK